MATAAKRAIKRIEDTGDDIGENLAAQIASLREEIASISDSVSKYGNSHFKDAQYNAVAVVDQVRHQGAVAARQISRQANVAGKAVQENPIPVIVALGTIALISALIFTANDR
jgi:phage host-nuclease inhibitor protein Gam